ncbi:MAG: hypothetical protein ACREMY_33795, partial [bacterium]
MLDGSQSDITPWLIGVGAVVLLVVIVGIILYMRGRQVKGAAKAAENQAKEVRAAAAKAQKAAEEAEKAAQETEDAVAESEQSMERVFGFIGDHAVSQSIVDQAVQAQGAATYTIAVNAIELAVEAQLKERGNAEQALVDAHREAGVAQRAAMKAEERAREAKDKAKEAEEAARIAKQKAEGVALGPANEAADQAEQASLRA